MSISNEIWNQWMTDDGIRLAEHPIKPEADGSGHFESPVVLDNALRENRVRILHSVLLNLPSWVNFSCEIFDDGSVREVNKEYFEGLEIKRRFSSQERLSNLASLLNSSQGGTKPEHAVIRYFLDYFVFSWAFGGWLEHVTGSIWSGTQVTSL